MGVQQRLHPFSRETHLSSALSCACTDAHIVLQIEEEFKKILDAKTGNPETPFALTSAASKEVGASINTGIQ